MAYHAAHMIEPTSRSHKTGLGRYLQSAPRNLIVVLMVLCAALIAIVLAFAIVVHLANSDTKTIPIASFERSTSTSVQTTALTPTIVEPAAPPVTITLSAVGDNLMNMPVVDAADYNLGVYGDGLYDFTPMYAGVTGIVGSHDLNFIDIETMLGGDYLGITGYPSFNSPSVIADQVQAFGWNLATTATNHSWDYGFEAITNSSATWTAHPSVTETGTFVSAEDRANIRVREVKGVRVAFLAYTDYLNGYELPQDYWYAIAMANWDAMAADITSAKAQADVVIVAMSWGEENSTTPNDFQLQTAQFLADQGVDLVIGFGPHVIQPVQWYTGNDAAGQPTGHRTLVAFSLGNFLSNQPLAIENVEGCLTCSITVTRTSSTPSIEISNVGWTPLVNHISNGWHQVFTLADYTAAGLAYSHESIGLEANPVQYPYDVTNAVIDPQIATIYS